LHGYHNFYDFQDGCSCHLGFLKIRSFNGQSAVGNQYASPCQISPKLVKRLQSYGDLTVFKMATVRHVGFLKFKFLTVGAVKRPIWHHRTKFRKDRPNRCGDIAIFVIFKMAANAIWPSSKIRNFNGRSAVRCQCVTVPNFIKIGQTVAEIWRLNGFFSKNGGRTASWICWARLRPHAMTTWWSL